MSKVIVGDFCAHIPGAKFNEKGTYKKIGVVFKDSERGTFSIKIDSLPLPGSGWTGWCNVFEESKSPRRAEPNHPTVEEDDIPF